MIYNGFDPGMLALLAGEDRVVTDSGEATEAGDPRQGGLLVIVSAGILLACAILLSGLAA